MGKKSGNGMLAKPPIQYSLAVIRGVHGVLGRRLGDVLVRTGLAPEHANGSPGVLGVVAQLRISGVGPAQDVVARTCRFEASLVG